MSQINSIHLIYEPTTNNEEVSKFTVPTTREFIKKLILAVFKLLGALGWRRISHQPNLGPARLSVLSVSLREDESNGVIFDCRGSFPTSVFFSTSKGPFE